MTTTQQGQADEGDGAQHGAVEDLFGALARHLGDRVVRGAPLATLGRAVRRARGRVP